MKQVLNFLRSMRFGMLLLCLILLCALPGSMIEQGREAGYYLETYSWGEVLLFLQFDRIFSSFYFAGLLGALCLNLLLCSLLRGRNTCRLCKSLPERLLQAELQPAADTAGIEALFCRRGMKCIREKEGRRVYRKNALGHFGSFVTHLGLLLSLLFAAAGLYFARVEDYSLCVGESIRLSDGTEFTLTAFSTEGEGGKVDYRSRLTVRDKQGAESGERQIRVNEPLNFGGHKFYQQNYGTVGRVEVRYGGKTDIVSVGGQAYFTLDNVSGLGVYGIYPDHKLDENGKIHPISEGPYRDPIYIIGIEDGENSRTGAVKVGDVRSVGGADYRFLMPESYSGIRIKTVSPLILGGLYLGFVLLTLGLFLCFFAVPVYGVVGEKGYSLRREKPDPMLERQLKTILDKEKTNP